MAAGKAIIFNIQALRAVAAFMVVAHHLAGTAHSYGPKAHLLSFFWIWGASGVDIFFVISGFVMYYTQHRKPKSAGAFFVGRLARIVPVYWTLTIALAALFLLLPAAFASLDFSIARTLQSLFFVGGLFHRNPLLGMGWTLEVEMFFYVVFAAGIALNNRAAAMILCVVALTTMAVIGPALSIEFLFGMACAALFIRYPTLSIGLPAILLGSALLIASLPVPHPGTHRVWLWGIPATLIVMGALYLPQTNNRIAIYLGAASYSIYLAQAFSIPAFYKMASRYFRHADGDAAMVIGLLSSAGLGCLIYEGLEKPVAKLIKRARSRPLPPPTTNMSAG